jgi:hypothetical protein
VAEKHYVDFFARGALDGPKVGHVPIAAWDATVARTMALTIIGPNGERPYGFRFSTWDDVKGKPSVLLRWSQAYFFGGSTLQADGTTKVRLSDGGKETYRTGDVILPALV